MTSGHVLWPDESNGYQNSGEGGLWAYVFFTAAPDAGKPVDFDDCISPSGVIALPQQDVVSHDDGIYSEADAPEYPGAIKGPDGNMLSAESLITVADAQQYAWKYNSYYLAQHSHGVSVLAAVCLGSTGQSLFSDSLGEYFRVTEKTLTSTGQKLVAQLANFYDRTPRFVTYLDT